MSQAGSAITVTSVTNFIAFGIGSTSSIPTLQSFCAFAAIGIFSIFIFQITWFTAILAIDERRIEESRNGCCCCLVHRETASNDYQSVGRTAAAFELLSKCIIKPAVQIVVVLLTLLLLGLGVYGLNNLRMEFRPEWLVDPQAEVTHWYFEHRKYFNDGLQGQIYLKNVDYVKSLKDLDILVDTFEKKRDIIKSVDSWHKELKKYVSEDSSPSWEHITPEYFQQKLSQFLHSPRGAKYKSQFKFSGDLRCGEPAPPVLVSIINYQHGNLESASHWVPAMDWVNMVTENMNISFNEGSAGGVFPLALGYSNWIVDKVIGQEIYQNMGSSLVAIFFTVLVFLASIRCSIMVILCVGITIVEVAGFMHFWGLTLDVISCNTLVIAVGLCVDFSVHIAHRFLATPGDRLQRVVNTLTKIGPAVLNGGFSTLLAFILLSTSQSYIFLSFFKIFFLICVFGLYHGLIVLPVMLAVAGPVHQLSDIDEYDGLLE
eukprot:TRINITY_DN34049_c0_g1_i2.p1 TRINITY_DN34049_c0_g1~~TRINITY_DN34049_c0_g1_i2.p1  ORF type:complete len:564 (-),score=121.57 TRINITY_DN34049_c0_g1_i2:171-1631(-)